MRTLSHAKSHAKTENFPGVLSRSSRVKIILGHTQNHTCSTACNHDMLFESAGYTVSVAWGFFQAMFLVLGHMYIVFKE